MPITYSIDETAARVHTVATGTLTDQEILEHKRALVGDPRYRPGMQEISDVRDVTELAVTPVGIRQMVAMDGAEADQLAGHRLAIVTGADVVFGVARMYQQSADHTPQTIGVFRTMEEAEAWLADATAGDM